MANQQGEVPNPPKDTLEKTLEEIKKNGFFSVVHAFLAETETIQFKDSLVLKSLVLQLQKGAFYNVLYAFASTPFTYSPELVTTIDSLMIRWDLSQATRTKYEKMITTELLAHAISTYQENYGVAPAKTETQGASTSKYTLQQLECTNCGRQFQRKSNLTVH